MKTSESIANATVNLFEAVGAPFLLNPEWAQLKFAPDVVKALNHKPSYALRALPSRTQIFDVRRINKYYKDSL
ncbi:MAG: hypothetical protein CMH30_07305 [Micavibrio sp.]|nr:hypothetical protein [Micavibrio sp.]|tara:strand:- start:2351 stop:2569 length:219 start_codon:yes stop_codon:yes gene_type:complete